MVLGSCAGVLAVRWRPGEQCRGPWAAGQGVGQPGWGEGSGARQGSLSPGVRGTERGEWKGKRPGEEAEREQRGVGEGRALPYSPGAGVTHRGTGGCSCCAAEGKLAALPRRAPSPPASLPPPASLSLPPSLLLFLLLLPSPQCRRGGAGGAAPSRPALCIPRARSPPPPPPRGCCRAERPGAEPPLREHRAAGHLAGR